jgi:hypothetical protein
MPKRSVPDWAAWWNEVLRRVDASETGCVRLTIAEIRAGSRCDHREMLDYIVWWFRANDAKVLVNNVKLYASELDWEPDIVDGDVVAVAFTRRMNSVDMPDSPPVRKCDKCDNPSTTRVTEVHANEVRSFNLCEEHARAYRDELPPRPAHP